MKHMLYSSSLFLLFLPGGLLKLSCISLQNLLERQAKPPGSINNDDYKEQSVYQGRSLSLTCKAFIAKECFAYSCLIHINTLMLPVVKSCSFSPLYMEVIPVKNTRCHLGPANSFFFWTDIRRLWEVLFKEWSVWLPSCLVSTANNPLC